MSDHDPARNGASGSERPGAKPSSAGAERPGAAPASMDGERRALAALDAAINEAETAKRWADVTKKLLEKAARVTDSREKVELLRRAGNSYIERFSNQAEAMVCFERVLEISPDDPEAYARLAEMYERRRDWGKLVRLMERRAERLPPSERAGLEIEVARLATARLRDPELRVSLWRKVLETDPSNTEAQARLAELSEGARGGARALGWKAALPAVVLALLFAWVVFGRASCG